jgi:hypothetical protein
MQIADALVDMKEVSSGGVGSLSNLGKQKSYYWQQAQ